MVGVNRFRMDEAESPKTFAMHPAIEAAQVARLREVRASRDGAALGASLDALEQAARGTANLMPRVVAAAESLATVGEISDRLRRVFGEYRESAG